MSKQNFVISKKKLFRYKQNKWHTITIIRANKGMKYLQLNISANGPVGDDISSTLSLSEKHDTIEMYYYY